MKKTKSARLPRELLSRPHTELLTVGETPGRHLTPRGDKEMRRVPQISEFMMTFPPHGIPMAVLV